MRRCPSGAHHANAAGLDDRVLVDVTLISGYSSMECWSVDAPKEVELDVLVGRWKIGVLIEYPYDIMAER
jgi:hypothetical protein